MSSTRGVEYDFEPGEVVLCFEPDTTKARVLYDAKIIEPSSTRDHKGRRRAEYLIHFQGWNSSWDRIVPDFYVLKSNTTTKTMQRKLAETARVVKNNRSRKRKIDDILRAHFKGPIPLDSSSDDDDDEDEDGENDDNNGYEEDDEEDFYLDGNQEEDEEIKFRTRPKNGHTRERRYKRKASEYTETEAENGDNSASDSDSENEVYSDGLEITNQDPVDLEIPAALRLKLEDDCYFIRRKNKLVKLPADPSVITILESHVKSFAINVLCATVEKLRPREQCPPPEKNIDLCKEVMDGIRVIFDFAMASNLLYAEEKAQHEKIVSSFHPVTGVKRESLDTVEQIALVQSPRLRSHSRRGSPAHSAECSPKVPRFSPKKVNEAEESSEDSDMTDDDHSLPSRRMTRHAYAEEIKKTKSTDKVACTSIPLSTPGSPTVHMGSPDASFGRRGSLRSSRQLSGSSQHSADSPKKSLAERVTPPPPLLIPTQISSTSACHTPTRSKCSTPPIGEQSTSDKEGALNALLSWKLIPDELYSATPAPPSVIYGAPHLLRLFVRLPELIGKMPIPEVRLRPLLKHLEMFLEYFSDRSEELLPDSLYVDACEAMGINKQMPSKK